MAKEAFCTTCQRTVYMGQDDGDGCPVCSSPLVEQERGATTDASAEDTAPAAEAAT